MANDTVFKQFFMDAEEARLTHIQLHEYYLSRRAKWDEYAIKETAMMDGRAEGMAAGIIEANTAVVRSLLLNTKHSVKEIAKLVNVAEEFVGAIKEHLDK